MNRRTLLGIITLITTAAVLFGVVKWRGNFGREKVTVLNYTAAKSTSRPFNFKIQTYNDIHGIDWYSNNEIILDNTRLSQDKLMPEQFGIYNLDTEKQKKFDYSNGEKPPMSHYIEPWKNISKDKKYLLFSDPIFFSNDSGKNYNSLCKLIDLSTGKVQDYDKLLGNEGGPKYNFIDNDKVFSFGYKSEELQWQITDLQGSIVKSGKLKGDKVNFGDPYAISEDSIIALEWPKIGAKVSYDIVNTNTGAIKSFYTGTYSQYSRRCIENNKIIIEDKADDTSTKLYCFDYEGNNKKEYTVEGYIVQISISPDGSKAAIIRYKDFSKYCNDISKSNNNSSQNPFSEPFIVDILDLKTGAENNIFQINSVALYNIAWSKDNHSILFSGSVNGEYEVYNTYIARIQ